MYTQKEAREIREKFWTSFGHYMSPIPAASGEKINWVNYKTGVKGIRFRMDADGVKSIIYIQVHHSQTDKQQIFIDHLLSLRHIFHDSMKEEWVWGDNHIEGQAGFFIYRELLDVNVLREADWPGIISFLKPRMIMLDMFWMEYKDLFEMLG